MFPLKSNLLPWKHFSLRSKQGMGRKEQEACNWISKREKHLREGDGKAGWPDAVCVCVWGGASLRGARQLERGAWTKSLLHPNESGRCTGRKGLQTLAQGTKYLHMIMLTDEARTCVYGGRRERDKDMGSRGNDMTWQNRGLSQELRDFSS